MRDDYFINKPKHVVRLGQGKMSESQFIYFDSTVFWNASLVVNLRCVSSKLHCITYQHTLESQIEPQISVIRDGLFFFPSGARSRPRLPYCRGFEITHTHTQTTLGRIPLDKWPARRRGNTQHTQETEIHATGGIQTRNPSKRGDVDPSLKGAIHSNLNWAILLCGVIPDERTE